jgi:hypothetical protein
MSNAILPEIILSDNNKNFFVKDTSGNFIFDKEEHPPFSLTSQFTSLVNVTSGIMFVGFLIIYFVLYYGLGKLLGAGVSTDILKTRAINLSVFSLLILGIVYFYYSLPAINQQHFFTYLMVLFKEEMNDPNMIGIMILVLILFYIFVWVMGFPMGKDTKPLSLEIIEVKSWAYLIMLIFIMFFIYVLHIEVVDYVYQKGYEWWNEIKAGVTPQKARVPAPAQAQAPAPKSASPATVPKIDMNSISKKIEKDINDINMKKAGSLAQAPSAAPKNEEVFNIGNNLYTYDDAQAICKSFDARLATYDEIEESYEDGGEWCNYGWSEDQMILFPTQKSTWKELQKDPKAKNNCGRPGINGGYMPNPYVKFGVNCYGKKPDPNKLSKSMFDEMNKPKPPPAPAQAPAPDPAVEYWKAQQDTIRMNAFNKKEWSEFSNVK